MENPTADARFTAESGPAPSRRQKVREKRKSRVRWVPKAVGVSVGAQAVFEAIKPLVGRSPDRTPRQEVIAAWLGCAVRTLRGCLAELVDAKMIVVRMNGPHPATYALVGKGNGEPLGVAANAQAQKRATKRRRRKGLHSELQASPHTPLDLSSRRNEPGCDLSRELSEDEQRTFELVRSVGMSLKNARKVATTHSLREVELQNAHLRCLHKRPASPPAWLYRAIVDGYKVPTGLRDAVEATLRADRGERPQKPTPSALLDHRIIVS